MPRNRRTYTVDAQAALGFLISQLAIIEPGVYKTRYPAIQYRDLIPIVTQGNEWAKSVTFFSMDQVGQAAWFSHRATDMPLADVLRDIHETGIYMSAIGYDYTIEELGQAMMIPGTNLESDKADAARLAAENFCDDVGLRGDSTKAMEGLYNSSAVTPHDAADIGGGVTEWTGKTADEISADINDALTGVYVDSKGIETANTILLPLAEYARIANTRLANLSMTLLQFILQNNSLSAQTGEQLMIRAVRGLETAGDGGTQRMVVYRRDPQVVRFHMPMPHRFEEVWRTGPLIYTVPGIMRIGGTEIRRPGAVRYVDGI